jgi:hypothetical protein
LAAGVPQALLARGAERLRTVYADHGLSPQATCVTPVRLGGAKHGSRNPPPGSVQRHAFGLPTSNAELWVHEPPEKEPVTCRLEDTVPWVVHGSKLCTWVTVAAGAPAGAGEVVVGWAPEVVLGIEVLVAPWVALVCVVRAAVGDGVEPQPATRRPRRSGPIPNAGALRIAAV